MVLALLYRTSYRGADNKIGTFSIPITKEAQHPGPGVYQIPTNDHDGNSQIK